MAVVVQFASKILPAGQPGQVQNQGMARDKPHHPDPNANGARIVRESAVVADKLPNDAEAAWKA